MISGYKKDTAAYETYMTSRFKVFSPHLSGVNDPNVASYDFERLQVEGKPKYQRDRILIATRKTPNNNNSLSCRRYNGHLSADIY